MNQGTHDFGGGHAAVELDPRSGAFVNATAPGVDGSVLGTNTELAVVDRRFAWLPGLSARGRYVLGAALGAGLLALGWSLLANRPVRRSRWRAFGWFA